MANALRGAGEKLHIAEVAQAAKRAQQDATDVLKGWDAKYALSARAGAAGAAVAQAARKLDDATGASRGAHAVVNAASVAAKEVDENWRVSERARGVVNGALRDDRIAPAARVSLARSRPRRRAVGRRIPRPQNDGTPTLRRRMASIIQARRWSFERTWV